MLLNRKTVFFLFTILLSQSLLSQDVKFSSGPELRNYYSIPTQQLLGSNENGFFALKFKDPASTLFLDQYDFTMKLISQKEFKLPLGHNYTYFIYHKAEWLNNNLYLFYSRFDRKLGGNVLSVAIVNPLGQIIESKELSKVESTSELKRGSFKVFISKDGSKICVYKNDELDIKKQPNLNLEVFDINLNKLHSKKFNLSSSEKKFTLEDVLVDSIGNIHLVARVFQTKHETDDTKSISNYEIHSYFHKEDLLKTFDVNLGSISINQIALRLDSNDNLMGAGLYSEKGPSSSSGLSVEIGKAIKGTFLFIIDMNKKEVALASHQEFGKELLSQFKSDKDKLPIEPKEYTIREVFVRDSNVAIIAENNSFETPNYNLNADLKSIYHLKSYEQNFNDIIATSISRNGKAEWAIRIPKKQTINTVKYKHLGIGVFMINNTICILYNENPKNLNKDSKDYNVVTMGDETAATFTLISIDQNGNYTKKGLFRSLEKVTIMNPKFNLQISPTSVLIFGEEFNNYRIVKLDF